MGLEVLLYSDVVPYVASFIIIFAISFFGLNRSVFKDNKNISTVIAACISLLATWGLTNYTGLMYSFQDFIQGLETSSSLVLFLIGLGVVVFLIYLGMKRSKKELPLIMFGLAGLFILVKFIPDIFSVYWLPDWLENPVLGWFSLVIGVLIFVYAIIKMGKKRKKVVLEY